jgi:hypothetical protein
VTFFERLRAAESPEAAKALFARALAEAPLASADEIAALRRGVRERIHQLDAGLPTLRPQVLPTPARFGGRLGLGPRRSRTRTVSPAAAGGGATLLVFLAVMGTCGIARLFDRRGSVSGSGEHRFTRGMPPVPRVEPVKLTTHSVEWIGLRDRVDRLLARDPPPTAELVSIARRMGWSVEDVSRMLVRLPAESPDRGRLQGLLVAMLENLRPR